jgi:hypothetical protein
VNSAMIRGYRLACGGLLITARVDRLHGLVRRRLRPTDRDLESLQKLAFTLWQPASLSIRFADSTMKKTHALAGEFQVRPVSWQLAAPARR